MSVHFEDSRVTLHHGDCLDVLRSLPDASVDSVVTDPPYSLSFMGKGWDTHDSALGFQQWCEQWARECLRVLRPGGHLLSFGGSRTYHRMTSGVEDAGFEIRDCVTWHFGSGFPKSLDVSKAIDKQRTEDKEPTRVICRSIRAAMDARGLASRHLVEHFDGCHPRLIDHWAARDTDSQPSLPTWGQWETLAGLFPELNELDREVWRLNERKGAPGAAWDERPDANYSGGVGMAESWTNGTGWNGKASKGGEGVTDAAREWAGWGTALKPATEFVVVARKPLVGTVAANVLTHGTGALNIDGCRIEHASAADLATSLSKNPGRDDTVTSGVYGAGRPQQQVNTSGRWPANVILDEDMAGVLDEQSGTVKGAVSNGKKAGTGYAENFGAMEQASGYGDTGGASRFFKVIPTTSRQDQAWTTDGSTMYAGTSPDCGSESSARPSAADAGTSQTPSEATSSAGAATTFEDDGQPPFLYQAKAPKRERPVVDGVAHPTVKPLALMRWLVRLVTPPGGTVLEPFAGSGTTVEACLLEGFRCIAIEKGDEYLPLILERIARQDRAKVEAEVVREANPEAAILDQLGAKKGRWPANVLLDPEMAAVLDEQSGTLTSGNLSPKHTLRASANTSMSGPNQARNPRQEFGGDTGGASRFFGVMPHDEPTLFDDEEPA